MSSAPAEWSATLPGSAVRLDIEPVDPDRHAQLVHGWMHRPHVIPWWQLDRPLDEIHHYLAGLTHLRAWIVSADGVPFGYVETYRAVDDPLAGYYLARTSDVGWHLLVGPERFLGSGLPRLLGYTFVADLLGLAGPSGVHHGDRVVCEPDVRNTRMHTFCRRLGFHPIGTIDLPEKRALLMACTTEEFRSARRTGTGSSYTEVSS
ncbi:GNAT family N-acetyltransferase [Phytoactinopolyspora limicola]|uniref:GNAT family N-acetyltransferase n=1 Tax=Phytoactinopolyspora limicola TaxID=2715536 RepID=UPI00140C4622|nr:GNAT family N-acetyltransferase [Phytoactinopolyspora limicola]